MLARPFRTPLGSPVTEARLASPRLWGLAVLAVALLPALTALAVLPWFSTQDGPAHVYNAHVVAESLRPASPFRAVYDVRWRPLPNWAGHLALMGLMSALPPRAAGRAVMAATLVGLAGSSVWLRWRVAGWRGMPLASLWSALLAMNVTWLFGFDSFLIGACLFPITLGVWWGGREGLGWGRISAVAGLLVLGYVCHPVSLALTAAGLAVLAAMTPGPRRLNRLLGTAASLSPLIPLAILYRRSTRAGGPLMPVWSPIRFLLAPDTWSVPLKWLDPLVLRAQTLDPGSLGRPDWHVLQAPMVWLLAVAAALAVASRRGGQADPEAGSRRGWAWLAALTLIGGLVGPDTLGPAHGEYLPQRVLLLGLVALLPALNFDDPGLLRQVVGAVLAALVGLQSVLVWDYARRSDRLVGEFVRGAAGPVGRNQRVGTLLIGARGPYRANPLLHADCWLGVGTGNVLWTNYETRHYYFPVQVRGDVPHPPALAFEAVSARDDPGAARERALAWAALLGRHHGRIDRLVVWGADPALDAVTAGWFEPVGRPGRVRTLRPRVDARY